MARLQMERLLGSIYCDVPGSPCLSKNGVVCWKPHLAGTQRYAKKFIGKTLEQIRNIKQIKYIHVTMK